MFVLSSNYIWFLSLLTKSRGDIALVDVHLSEQWFASIISKSFSSIYHVCLLRECPEMILFMAMWPHGVKIGKIWKHSSEKLWFVTGFRLVGRDYTITEALLFWRRYTWNVLESSWACLTQICIIPMTFFYKILTSWNAVWFWLIPVNSARGLGALNINIFMFLLKFSHAGCNCERKIVIL